MLIARATYLCLSLDRSSSLFIVSAAICAAADQDDLLPFSGPFSKTSPGGQWQMST
jgi:hypothetical protein